MSKQEPCVEKPMKVCVYMRVAQAGEQHLEGLEGQRHRLMNYAQSKGFDVVCEIQECASANRLNRAGIRQLFEKAKTDMFDAVLVQDVSRLARRPRDMISLAGRLRHAGVEVYAANGQQNVSAEAFKYKSLTAWMRGMNGGLSDE